MLMGGTANLVQSCQSCTANESWDKDDDHLYSVGKKIEIDYVIQHHKESSFSKETETKCVTQIRVEK